MLTRRDATKLIVLGTAATVWTMPTFAAQQPLRLPLSEFVADTRLLNALRKGVAAMRRRKPSDPLSWFYQAAIHGVTDYLWSEQVHEDPDVHKVDRAKYWNQCPHKGENSANFLPWHRGYTYHFEQILRMHSEEADFALPYWDYSQADQRDFPREFGIEHLDGNPKNDDASNINPLFHADRDYFLCGYEHPFTDQLPLTTLSSRAVDASRAMKSPVFFGDIESEGVGGGIADNDPGTRGLFEQAPHDQIHRAVGGNVQGINDDHGNPTFAVGGMAIPQTAGFDPIFPVHHANMDRLWARWACMPGKDWGKLPEDKWFDEKPWFFFDTTGAEVNRPRRDYFDHQALGVRFKDDDPSCKALQLPAPAAVVMVMSELEIVSAPLAPVQTLRASAEITAPPDHPTTIPLHGDQNSAVEGTFDAILESVRPEIEKVVLTLHDVDIGRTGSTGFDAYLIIRGTSLDSLSPESPSYLGVVSLFNHGADATMKIDQSFDITAAMAALNRKNLQDLEMVLSPYALTTTPKADNIPAKPVWIGLSATGYSVSRSRRDVIEQQMDHSHQ